MSEVPTTLLRELLEETKDGDWGKTDPHEGHVAFRVIRATDFAAVSVGNIGSVPLRHLPVRTVGRRTLAAGDILIETAGGSPGRPTGRTMLVTPEVVASFDLPITCASFARFLRVKADQVDPRYLYWHLQSLYQSGEIEQYQVQHTGVARFQYTDFASTHRVPLPPLNEQSAIAEVLGALDDKIAANTKFASSLAEMASLQFNAAVMHADRALPLAELVSTQYGVTTSAHDLPGPKFLRVTDINKRPWIEWDSAPNCTVSDEDLVKYRVSPGDILVARMADPGKAAYIDLNDPEAVFASYLVRLKAHDPETALYLFCFLRSPLYTEYADGAMTGSVQKNMNAKVIVSTDVPLPEVDQIRRFNSRVEPLRAQIQCTLNENRTLAATRDTLLPQLMSGKLQVKAVELAAESLT